MTEELTNCPGTALTSRSLFSVTRFSASVAASHSAALAHKESEFALHCLITLSKSAAASIHSPKPAWQSPRRLRTYERDMHGTRIQNTHSGLTKAENSRAVEGEHRAMRRFTLRKVGFSAYAECVSESAGIQRHCFIRAAALLLSVVALSSI